ncbi:MAG: bifunctional 4-hydroxy-3-methylbut-2-enyl diphosphate reductase/30S ribosomal protein S1 [Oscillospiraceae bacterium]|nr:bifunctional 4-hydroxy-3-methylbut-2-enyl diphosphate reductase/30S ribosomal protein S1 [Oscillospiraceae bacterium]
MTPEIIIAKSAGFCFGVQRAVDLALETAREGKCFTVGPIVHNQSVMTYLAEQGVGYVDDWQDAPPAATLIVRSHGLGRDVWQAIHARQGKTVDATCPCVAKMHKLAAQCEQSGRTLLIIGSRNHPEVRGVVGWCNNHFIAENEVELAEFLKNISQEQSITMMAQATTVRAIWEKCVKTLKKDCTNVEIFDTICGATDARQRETVELAVSCDCMVVVGDRASANTEKLVKLSQQSCDNVVWVENAAQWPCGHTTGKKRIGVTAGASTPDRSIEEVVTVMTEEMKSGTNMNEGFEALLEQTFKTLSTGDRVVATVVGITPTEVQLELGTKHAGYIPIGEISNDPNAKPEDLFTVGQEVEVFVVHVSDNEGVVLCSRKKIETLAHYDVVHDAVKEDVVLEGIVIEENAGGVVVSVNGVRVFVPASLSGVPRETPLSSIMKQKVNLCILEYNGDRRRFVGSIRAAKNLVRDAAFAKVWETLKVGDAVEGEVKSLTKYGAFVDLGGIDGLLHVSEMSWSHVRTPEEFCKVGDVLKVRVIKMNEETKKISLSVKDPAQDPWRNFTEACTVDDIVKVKIVRFAPFGAFAEIMPHVTGLIHISEIAHEHLKSPADALAIEQEVEARILHIDHEKRKISLSIRATLEPPVPVKIDEDSSLDEVVASADSDGTVDVPQDVAEAVEEVIETVEVAEVIEEIVEAVEEAEVAEVAAEIAEAAEETNEE